MKAVYDIVSCCGHIANRIECELPVGCFKSDSYEAKREALRISGYVNQGRCSTCRNLRYDARFVGYPLHVPSGVEMLIAADSREKLIKALVAVIKVVQNAPSHVTFVKCDKDSGHVG